MASETKKERIVILVVSGLILVTSVILAGFYLAAMSDVDHF